MEGEQLFEQGEIEVRSKDDACRHHFRRNPAVHQQDGSRDCGGDENGEKEVGNKLFSFLVHSAILAR